MNDSVTQQLGNAQACPLDKIPRLDFVAFRRCAAGALEAGQRVAAFFGVAAENSAVDLYLVLADDSNNRIETVRLRVEGGEYTSLTPEMPQFHMFEREIAEQFGVRPVGHPWLKPVRYRPSWNKDRDAWQRPAGQPIPPAVTDFYRVEGEDIHEVAVGPVHAGIIEPGHFRFQCHGENVFHLEIALGYQHRGIEEALLGGPSSRAIHLIETAAGDTTIGHATAYSQVVEALSGTKPPVRAQVLRGIMLELERLANHIGDLGALANDVAYLPTASYNGRIRGDFLNMTALVCGNRFGRGMVRPGGVRYDLEPGRVEDLRKRLEDGSRDATSSVDLLFDTPSVLARFENTGTLPADMCRQLNIVGPAARAAGLPLDIRQTHPSGIYRFAQIPLATWDSGDVFARAYVRWLEVPHSIRFIRDQLESLPGDNLMAAPKPLRPNHLAVALVEGWRGQICHVGIADDRGRLLRYKMVDPSFHNWYGLAVALRGQQVSDFPLCNKSFNLSYCGNDL